MKSTGKAGFAIELTRFPSPSVPIELRAMFVATVARGVEGSAPGSGGWMPVGLSILIYENSHRASKRRISFVDPSKR
jgi:hypothetical protein